MLFPAKPPRIRGVPLLGAGLDYLRDPLALITRARQMGGFVQVESPGPKNFVVTDPDLIGRVLMTQSHNFIKSEMMRLMTSVLGQGLLTSEGEYWRQQRRIVQPSFHKQRLEHYAPAIVECTERLMGEWKLGE